MSRHYHDSECTASALEDIATELEHITELLERLATVMAPTREQQEDAAWRRTSAAIRKQPPPPAGVLR